MSEIKDRFLATLKKSYSLYPEHGARSNEKIKVLHGGIQEEIKLQLGADYHIRGLSDTSSAEHEIKGMYYTKRVDVCVLRGDFDLGVISVKFVNSNYRQNINNYFEQQMGETANLRRNNLVFGHIFCITQPLPHYKRDGSVKKYEEIYNEDIIKYSKLAGDHTHPHAPDVQAFCVAKLHIDKNDQKKNKITGWCTRSDLSQLSDKHYHLLQEKLGIERFLSLFCQKVRTKYAEIG